MTNTKNVPNASKKPFVEPTLKVLDVKGTETGPFPDPSEFPTILQMS